VTRGSERHRPMTLSFFLPRFECFIERGSKRGARVFSFQSTFPDSVDRAFLIESSSTRASSRGTDRGSGPPDRDLRQLAIAIRIADAIYDPLKYRVAHV